MAFLSALKEDLAAYGSDTSMVDDALGLRTRVGSAFISRNKKW